MQADKIITGGMEFLKENRKFHFFLAGLLITLLVVITYWGALKNGFVEWDDTDYVIKNSLVRNSENTKFKDIFSTVVSLNYHPVTILSLRANNNICENCQDGISSEPFIRGNILIHILNSILVFYLVFVLFKKNITLAFLVAAVFAVHPMHVEPVAWVSGRKDVLYSFFFLSGLISYIKFRDKGKGKSLWLIFSFILFILSCLSKATAVVFPVVLILINYWLSEKNEGRSVFRDLLKAVSLKNLLILVPFFAVSVCIGLIAIRLQSGENVFGMFKFIKAPHDVVNTLAPFSLLQRVQIASYGFFVYIIKFFFPARLSILYPYPLLSEFSHGGFSLLLWLSLIAMILTVFLVLFSLRKTRLYFFAFGFYFLTIALVLHFSTVGTAMLAERYTYLPYIGLSLIPASLVLSSSIKTKRFFIVLSGCLIIVLMVLSKNQVKMWSDSITLWSQVIDKYPKLELPRCARGKCYYIKISEAKTEKEKQLFEDKALSDFLIAIRAGTKSADVFEGTGVIYESKGDMKSALKFLNRAILEEPKKGSAFFNRAMVYDLMNMKEDAIKDYSSALEYSPELATKILTNRVNLMVETGRFREAIADLDRLILSDNKNARSFSNRAFCKIQLKDISGALDDYRMVLNLNPGDQNTRKVLQVLIDSQKSR
jgi:tetratricopeptide (TPR) repeat protein